MPSLRRSGPTNQLYYIIDNLDRNLFNPILITLSEENKESMIQYFYDLNIKVEKYPLKKWEGIFRYPKGLIKLIKDYDPQTIHTSGFRVDRFASKYINFAPTVCTIRNYMFVDYPATYGKFTGNVMAIAHKKYLKSITKPIACSESIADEYKKKNNVKLDHIQNGVDINKFYTRNESEKIKLRKILSLPEDKIIYISTGHLNSRKDPLTSLKAFIKSDAYQGSVFLLLGHGNLKEKCVELAESHKNIKFVGRVSNVEDYLAASNIFISSSKAEGLPNAMLEAMSSGLGVCVSNIDPHLEIIEGENYVGSVFKVGEQEDCIESINKTYRLYSNKTLEKNNRELIVKNLSAENMSNKYQELYLKLANMSV